jgi:hypothetical protein
MSNGDVTGEVHLRSAAPQEAAEQLAADLERLCMALRALSMAESGLA